jgi:hypothetical protein
VLSQTRGEDSHGEDYKQWAKGRTGAGTMRGYEGKGVSLVWLTPEVLQMLTESLAGGFLTIAGA